MYTKEYRDKIIIRNCNPSEYRIPTMYWEKFLIFKDFFERTESKDSGTFFILWIYDVVAEKSRSMDISGFRGESSWKSMRSVY